LDSAAPLPDEIHDVGLTFGSRSTRTTLSKRRELRRVVDRAVWRDARPASGNLVKSYTGNAWGSEIIAKCKAGGVCLANLLGGGGGGGTAADARLRDSALSPARGVNAGKPQAHESENDRLGHIAEWVRAFNEKKAQIVTTSAQSRPTRCSSVAEASSVMKGA